MYVEKGCDTGPQIIQILEETSELLKLPIFVYPDVARFADSGSANLGLSRLYC